MSTTAATSRAVVRRIDRATPRDPPKTVRLTGTTAATSNPNDLIVAVCDNYNVQESWDTLPGFTSRPASSTSTTGWYDTTVTSTGTQTANIPLSSSDVGAGMIAAFASK